MSNTQKACERCGNLFWAIRPEHPLCWNCLKQKRDGKRTAKAIARRKAKERERRSWSEAEERTRYVPLRERRAKRRGL